MSPLLGAGLRYDYKVIVPGAQTDRRGEIGPASALLGGVNSPAAY
jgi:hypothetical protein